MNKRDYEIVEAYAQEIFGCSFDDLSDKEQNMLIAHVMLKNDEFLNHCGV